MEVASHMHVLQLIHVCRKLQAPILAPAEAPVAAVRLVQKKALVSFGHAPSVTDTLLFAGCERHNQRLPKHL